jgi:hypothetical protein
MSEMMTAEAIIEAEWLLAGYWTKPRFALQTEAGHWSDIDVLSYEPEPASGGVGIKSAGQSPCRIRIHRIHP